MQNSKAVKVLFVADGVYPYQIGGMQKFAFNWIKYMSEFVDLTVIHPHSDYQNIAQEKAVYIASPNIPAKLPGTYILQQLLWAKEVKKYLTEGSKERYKVIYFQGFSGFHALKAKQIQARKYLNLHGLEMFQDSGKGWGKRIFKFLAKKMIKNADVNIALSKDLSHIISAIAGDKKIVIWPNALDDKWMASYVQKSKGLKKWLFVGREEERKRLDLIEQCFKALAQDDPDMCLTLVGPIANQLDHPQIHYHGPEYDEEKMKNIYDQHDVFILMSDAEGVPTVLLEAMARGLLILSRNQGGINDLLNEKNAFLWKEGEDYPKILKSKWKAIEQSQDKKRFAAQKTLHNHLFLWSNLAQEMKSSFERN